MGRWVDVDDLVGTPEIAELLGISDIQTVSNWRRRYPAFPKPVVHLRQVMLWSEVEAWARQTGRLR